VVVVIIAVILISTSSGTKKILAGSPEAAKAAEEVQGLIGGIEQSANVLGSPTAPVTLQYFGPSLSTSGEMLTIEELLTLRARTENAGHVGHEHVWSWA
jgi:hypothetical protein